MIKMGPTRRLGVMAPQKHDTVSSISRTPIEVKRTNSTKSFSDLACTRGMHYTHTIHIHTHTRAHTPL